MAARFRALLALCALVMFGAATPAFAAGPCTDLGGGTKIGASTVLLATEVAAGSFTGSDGQKYTGLPGFCRVVALAAPSSASTIVIEIWLPLETDWNHKILGTGNGGFAGSIRSAALAGGLKRGYAVANTDMGTYPAAFGGMGYDAGDGRPETVKDWGYRATHEMAVLTKAVVSRYYGSDAQHSYFAGCSTGGHQALTEAQRFPDDYDAILAGAAGHNRTHLHAMFAWFSYVARQPGAAISPDLMSGWAASMRAACIGKDGGAPGDAFLTDPTQCSYAPRALLCKRGQTQGCLQESQTKALEAIYGGTRNPRTGALIYPPLMRGTEGLLTLLFSTGSTGRQASADLSRWVFGPGWDSNSFDFDQDMAKVDAALGADVNALDPDLSRFVARGGKLILFHGWSDPIVSPVDSVLYYDRLMASGHAKSDYARLFMAPGVSHCAGGDGPDLFGQGAEFGDAGSPDEDLLSALDRWATTGKAPETVLAKKYENSSPFGGPPAAGAKVIAERPLCAYPKIARYDGKGDPKAASSFSCSAASVAKYERPAAEYLR